MDIVAHLLQVFDLESGAQLIQFVDLLEHYVLDLLNYLVVFNIMVTKHSWFFLFRLSNISLIIVFSVNSTRVELGTFF